MSTEGLYGTASFKNCKAVLIESDSMAPVVCKGQKIIYSEIESIENGDFVFIKLKNGEYLFRRYHKDDTLDLVILTSMNLLDIHRPVMVNEDEIEFCYKMVGVKF